MAGRGTGKSLPPPIPVVLHQPTSSDLRTVRSMGHKQIDLRKTNLRLIKRTKMSCVLALQSL